MMTLDCSIHMCCFVLLIAFLHIIEVAAHVDDKSIAYGGVLNNYETLFDNSSEILGVAKFAVDKGRKNFPQTFPIGSNGEILEYQISDLQKLKVIYTHDDQEPFVFQVQDPITSEISTASLIWGVTYSFAVSWIDLIDSYIHTFVVSEYWDKKLYIYQHTFHKKIDHCSNGNYPKTQYCHQDRKSDTESDQSIEKGEDKYEQGAENLWLKDKHAYHNEDKETFSQNSCDKKSSGENCTNPEYIDFSILNYNIWNTNSIPEDTKFYKRRIKHLAKVCLESQADIIGFQEVRFEDGRGGSWGPNQVEHLANLLPGYQFVFQPAQIQIHGIPKRIEEGLAFFSRYPVVEHKFLLLSREKADSGDGHQRILLHVVIKIPEFGKVNVLNTHLALSHIARQRTVIQIWQYIQKLKGPVFLMGDFNAEAHNDEVMFLQGRRKLRGLKTENLLDLWLHEHGFEDDGFTFNTLEEKLSKRIDLVFMREKDGIIPKDIEILDDGTRREHAASDHLPLKATVRIQKK